MKPKHPRVELTDFYFELIDTRTQSLASDETAEEMRQRNLHLHKPLKKVGGYFCLGLSEGRKR